MEASYLKAHPFENRFPEWMPSLGPWQVFELLRFGMSRPRQSVHGFTVPRRP